MIKKLLTVFLFSSIVLNSLAGTSVKDMLSYLKSKADQSYVHVTNITDHVRGDNKTRLDNTVTNGQTTVNFGNIFSERSDSSSFWTGYGTYAYPSFGLVVAGCGIYSPSPNYIGFSTSSKEQMSINSDGNVSMSNNLTVVETIIASNMQTVVGSTTGIVLTTANGGITNGQPIASLGGLYVTTNSSGMSYVKIDTQGGGGWSADLDIYGDLYVTGRVRFTDGGGLSSSGFYFPTPGGFTYWNGSAEVYSLYANGGDIYVGNGSLTVRDEIQLGPTINSTHLQLFTDGTNTFQVDVYSVTNQLATVTYIDGIQTSLNEGLIAETNRAQVAESNIMLQVTAVSNIADSAWHNMASESYWTWTSDGKEITLTGYSGPSDVVVPDILDGLPVTGFGIIFAGSSITSVSGGANIKKLDDIDQFAFLSCQNLVSVSLKSVTVIGAGTFFDCPSLESVYLPKLEDMPYGQEFYGCYSLSTISFPLLRKISGGGDLGSGGGYSFFDCTNLVSVYLPNVEYVGDNTFDNCKNMVSISLPSAITIEPRVFNDCLSLMNVELPLAEQINPATFVGCSSLKEIYIPRVVSILAPDANTMGSGYTSIYLPMVTNITGYAFRGNADLNAVYFGALTAPQDGPNIYSLSPNVTNYVLNPMATGWGTTFGGRPVVRLPMTTESLNIGPLINSTNMLIFSDGTNVYQRDVNNVTGKVITTANGGITNGQDSVTLMNVIVSNVYTVLNGNITNQAVVSPLGIHNVSTIWQGTNADYTAISEKDDKTLYVTTDDTVYDTLGLYNVFDFYHQLDAPMTTMVQVVQEKTIYKVDVNTNIVLAFDMSTLNFTNKVANFELWMNITHTNGFNITWPSGIEWLPVPEMTVTGQYKFAVCAVATNSMTVKQTYPTVYKWHISSFAGSGGITAMYTPNRYTSFLSPSVTNRTILADAPFSDKYTLFRYRVYGGHSGSAEVLSTAWIENILTSEINGGSETNIVENNYSTSSSLSEVFAIPPLGNQAAGYYFLRQMCLVPTGLGITIHSPESREMNELEVRAYQAGWRP